MPPHVAATLMQIPPDQIEKNPDNPRLIFRDEEMDVLMNSIASIGIQVPITVYRERATKMYVLMDGERRWRCAIKLNLKTVPALVHPKPSKLNNILQMFNIHNVREAWDLLPTAYKLQELEELLKSEGKRITPTQLATLTGLKPGRVRQAQELLSLPESHRNRLMDELSKPKLEQKVSEDLYLEIIKAEKAIKRHAPEALQGLNREQTIGALAEKYERGIVDSVTQFRDISRMARGEVAGVSKAKTVPLLRKLITQPDVPIGEVYRGSVAAAYARKDLLRRIGALTKDLGNLDAQQMDDRLAKALRDLKKALDNLLG